MSASSSELSELTSNVSSDEEEAKPVTGKKTIDHYFKQGPAAAQNPPTLRRKRAPSPPHEYVLADNADIAFICMFRSRFSDVFPKSLPHFGPQDVEGGVVGNYPEEYIEKFLCALIGLVLNRKKDIEKGHYSRALEESIQTHSGQWPSSWEGRNPLHGGGSFNTMTPEQRLKLMKTLVLWSLESSEQVRDLIRESYKQARHDDDLNQPLSVQSWGRDGDKRRFWLIEGREDTHFRLYRESNPALRTVTWRSVAGSIDELKVEADKLKDESTQASRRLHDRILAAIPRFEAGEEKRRRRDYRMARRAQFSRPEPGFSLYEGRTRGKRVRYTYSDDDDDDFGVRRSSRHSGVSTPVDPSGPTFTASGRQVRPRHGGAYGETLLNGEQGSSEAGGDAAAAEGAVGGDEGDDEMEDEASGLASGSRQRSRQAVNGQAKAREDFDDESDDGGNDDNSSGNEWQGDGNEDEEDDDVDDDDNVDEEDESDGVKAEADDDEDDSRMSGSLVVKLRYNKGDSGSSPVVPTANGTAEPAAASPPAKDESMPDAPEAVNLVEGAVATNGQLTPAETEQPSAPTMHVQAQADTTDKRAPTATARPELLETTSTPPPPPAPLQSPPPSKGTSAIVRSAALDLDSTVRDISKSSSDNGKGAVNGEATTLPAGADPPLAHATTTTPSTTLHDQAGEGKTDAVMSGALDPDGVS